MECSSRSYFTKPDHYAAIFDCANEAIMVETLDGHIVDVNSAACELLQFSREELIGLHVSELVPGNGVVWVDELLKTGRTGGVKSVIYCKLRKDGSAVKVDASFKRFHYLGHEYLLEIDRDITAQQHGEKSGLRQIEQLASLHESSIELLKKLNLEDLLKYLMNQAGELFGSPDVYIYSADAADKVLKIVTGVGKNADWIGFSLKFGEGLAGQVAESGEPCFVWNYPAWGGRLKGHVAEGLQAAVCIPLKSGQEVIGVIGIDFFDAPHLFSDEEMLTFSRFAELASVAMVNAKLHSSLARSEEKLQQKLKELLAKEEEIQQQNMVLTSLNKTALGLMQRHELSEVLNTIIASATVLLKTPNGCIDLFDSETGLIVNKVGLGIFAEQTGRKYYPGEGLVSKVYQSGEIVIVDDYSKWENRLPDLCFDQMHSAIQVPLKIAGRIVGTLCLTFTTEDRRFSDWDISLISRFAELAAIALDNATLFSSYKQEIAERKKIEESLRISEGIYKKLYEEFEHKQSLLSSLINSIPDLIFYKNCDSVYLGCNKAFENFAGMTERELIGRTDFDIFDQDMAELFKKKDLEMLTQGQARRNEELVRYPDGSKVYLETMKTPYCDGNGVVQGLIGVSRDITDRKRKEEKIIYLSLYDSLTGLYNRTFFEEEMSRLQNSHSGLASLIVCDVDGLKLINDTLGHNAGDIMLKSIAAILKSSFAAEDVVARIGGDEFAVILLSEYLPQDLEMKCKSIQERINDFNVDNPTTPISLSIGFAIQKYYDDDLVTLFKEADNNMYREKLHHKMSGRSAVVQALIKALEARDFITEGHGNRLQHLVNLFATKLKLPKQQLSDLKLLARFHDLGKVGIPDNILFKPGKLTEGEYAIMRQHCDIGYRIAKSTPDLEPIADWILRHHEWWNGQGYPLGIRGAAIPLACRILSIIDAFDAMTSDRPYRKAMSYQAAVDELERCAGTQFDPVLVEVFIGLQELAVTGGKLGATDDI